MLTNKEKDIVIDTLFVLAKSVLNPTDRMVLLHKLTKIDWYFSDKPGIDLINKEIDFLYN